MSNGTIDETFAGKFLDNIWPEHSKTLMSDIKEAIELANRDGRTTSVTLKVIFKRDDENGEITPKLEFGGQIAKRSKTGASFNLQHNGQISFDEVVDPLSAANEEENAGLHS